MSASEAIAELLSKSMATDEQKTKSEILGYAVGEVLDVKPSENGKGYNLKVRLAQPIGECEVYVKKGRAIPEVGTETRFVAVLDEGALSPRIRLASNITAAAVSEVFTKE